MRRLALLAVFLLLSVSTTAQTPQPRPLQADGVVRLLADLEAGLGSARIEDFSALAGATLPNAEAALYTDLIGGGPATVAAIRERARRPIDNGVEVLAEVLVGHGRRGRLATWQITARPTAADPSRYELVGLQELATIDDLLQLSLNTEQQYAVKNLVFRGPDFTLELSSGSAFAAESNGGITGLVLRGRGTVRFTPENEAERGQLRLFAGRPAFEADIESAFLRINPNDVPLRMNQSALSPSAVNPEEVRRALEIFDDRSPRSYTLDLSDLTQETWSLEPTTGGMIVEFRSRRHGWLTYSRSPGEPEDISFFDRGRTKNISVYASKEQLAERGRFYSDDDTRGYDVIRHGLDVTFDPARSWISGRAAMLIRVVKPLVNTLTFKLAEPLAISAVSSTDYGRLLTLRIRGQSNVIVSLPRALRAGTELVLDVSYNGRLNPQMLDREAIAPQGQQTQDPFAIERILIAPEPRYLYSNRVYWYPQGETSDFATAAMRLTVPSEFQVVASGRFVNSSLSEVPASESGAGDAKFRRTVEYEADRPARYMAVVISRFVPIDRVQVTVPAVAPIAFKKAAGARVDAEPIVEVEVVSTPRMTSRNRQTPARVADMLRFYATRLGEAPYPNFTLAGLDDNLPGGHSPAFFAVLHQPLPTTPFSWVNDPVSFDQIYPHFFLAHEVAHQWFGQAIGWKNYHEQWLSEGFAQYFAMLYAEQERGPEAVTEIVKRMRASAVEFSDRGPIYLGYRLGHVQSDGRVFRAIVYNKAAVVLHMLRRLIGDDAFFAGVRDFYATWRFKKAGTNDLRVAFEKHTPMKLERFFDRWVLGADLPRVRVATEIANDGQTAIVRVEQTGGVFDFPLAVTIQYADGTSEQVDVKISEATSEHRLARQRGIRRVTVRDELSLAVID
jgi:hypothetical protein